MSHSASAIGERESCENSSCLVLLDSPYIISFIAKISGKIGYSVMRYGIESIMRC